MRLALHLAAAAALALAASPALSNTVKTAVKSKAKSKAVSVAKAALPTAAVALPALSDSQLAMAERVHVGKSDCEFSQSVQLDPHESHKGAFHLSHKNNRYVMVPEDTTTGAVRLEDKKNGLVWIQIGNKSMLMNSKIGQRVVDNCIHANQLAAAQAAGNAHAK